MMLSCWIGVSHQENVWCCCKVHGPLKSCCLICWEKPSSLDPRRQTLSGFHWCRGAEAAHFSEAVYSDRPAPHNGHSVVMIMVMRCMRARCRLLLEQMLLILLSPPGGTLKSPQTWIVCFLSLCVRISVSAQCKQNCYRPVRFPSQGLLSFTIYGPQMEEGTGLSLVSALVGTSAPTGCDRSHVVIVWKSIGVNIRCVILKTEHILWDLSVPAKKQT